MKRIPTFALAIMLLTAVSARAGILKVIWDDLRTNSEVHVFDNLIPSTFYDFEKDEWLTGGVTSIYSYRILSLDLGVIDDSKVGYPIAGINAHFGEQLHRILPDNIDQGFMKYVTLGGFCARDLTNDVWKYGFYTGAEIRF